MTSITTGSIAKNNVTFDGSSPTYSATINGNQMQGYNTKYPIYNPSGFFSRPMPGRQALFTLSPYGTIGYAMGFTNASPGSGTNNINALADGEVAICETSGFNFSMQAKINQLLALFTNGNNTQIASNIAIGQNIVTCLTDIVAEIVALEASYNAHRHTYIPGSNPATLNSPITPSYAPTSNFTRDRNFLANSPSKMYVDLNGDFIS